MPKPTRNVPPARSVITAAQPEAAHAGADILRAGGSAIDAVIAAALVQGVVDPLMCGIGGFGSLHIFDPATGDHRVLDGQGGCPAAVRPDMWADRIVGETRDGFGFILKNFENECGHSSVCVPGIVAVLAKAHGMYGRLVSNGLQN